MSFDYAAKIQALLANADNEALSDEARSAYRAKAEEFMIRYRIAEEEALATDATSSSPIVRDVTLYTGTTTMATWYTSVYGSIAHHTGVRYMVHTMDGRRVARTVGYDGDIRYTEFLWTSALLMFATRIDPRWDDTLPEGENIWRLRNAGIQRRVIADRAWGNGREASARSKVQRIYARECERRGEPVRAAGLSHNTDTYRQSYAMSFLETLQYRLREARDAVDAVRGGLVLHGRAERVDEAFYAIYPYMRPTPRTDDDTPAEPCPACKKAKSGHCRQHPASRWTKADEARYRRLFESPSARAGQASGKAAADGVVIQRGHTRATRVEAGSDNTTPEITG